jgi:hypothetical protein
MGDQVSYPKGLFIGITVLMIVVDLIVIVPTDMVESGMPLGIALIVGAILLIETLIAGISPLWGGISSEAGSLNIRMGLLFRVTIPLDKLESVEVFRERMPLYLRYGVHIGPKSTIAAVTSMKAIIHIRTKERVRSYLHGFPYRVRTVYISVNDPEAVLSMVRPVLGKIEGHHSLK